MTREKFRQRLRVRALPLHPQRQRLSPHRQVMRLLGRSDDQWRKYLFY